MKCALQILSYGDGSQVFQDDDDVSAGTILFTTATHFARLFPLISVSFLPFTEGNLQKETSSRPCLLQHLRATHPFTIIASSTQRYNTALWARYQTLDVQQAGLLLFTSARDVTCKSSIKRGGCMWSGRKLTSWHLDLGGRSPAPSPTQPRPMLTQVHSPFSTAQ